jgi:DUF4097 and DUF4098 domain-containing protein YvlB
MKNRKYQILLVCLTALALPLASRAERIEQTFAAEPDSVVEIRNLNGRVTLQSWNQPQVKVVALRRSRAVEVHLEQNANHIHIHTHLLQASTPASERSVDMEVWAPANANLEIHLEAGMLQVENFTRDINVEAVAATVLLRNVSGHTSVQTLNGSIRGERCSGRIEATSISGSLEFSDMTSRFLVARTTSGDIYYEGNFRPGGSYDFLNHEGSIELRVPANASFELRANSVKGEVENELPITSHQHGRLPRPSTARSLLGTVQTGEAMVRVTSFSGTIRLRKQ